MESGEKKKSNWCILKLLLCIQTADKDRFPNTWKPAVLHFPIMSTLWQHYVLIWQRHTRTEKWQDTHYKDRTGNKGHRTGGDAAQSLIITREVCELHTPGQEMSNPYTAPSSKSPHDLNSNDKKTQFRVSNVPINSPPIEWMSPRELQRGVVQSLMPPFLIIHNTFLPGKCQRVIA